MNKKTKIDGIEFYLSDDEKFWLSTEVFSAKINEIDWGKLIDSDYDDDTTIILEVYGPVMFKGYRVIPLTKEEALALFKQKGEYVHVLTSCYLNAYVDTSTRFRYRTYEFSIYDRYGTARCCWHPIGGIEAEDVVYFKLGKEVAE